MAKGRSGGKRNSQATPTIFTSTTPPPIQQVIPPTLQQIANGNVLPQGGVPFSKFEQMTDDEKADVITQALGQTLPVFLDDSSLQKLAYYTGLSDKPTIMTEGQINHIAGKSLWRSVKSVYNSQTDIGYTGKEIYDQIATGDFTMYSDSGGSVYGKAIYFDTSKGSYGSGGKYTIIHAKVLPTAKVGDYYTVQAMAGREMTSGSKLGRAIASAPDHASRVSLYALAKGYDVLQDGANGYRMVLNRRGIAVSDQTF